MDTKKLQIDIWSDIACPWCYVGKRRLEAALAQFPERDAVEVKWRAFELDPAAPAATPDDVPYAQRLARKYRASPQEAQGMIDRMASVAAKDGLDFHFERARPGNTFDAHRLLHLAGERGKQDAMKERLLRAYMTEGQLMSDREGLVRLAGEVGLDTEEVRAALAGDLYSREVRADEAEAQELGITGVPFFVIAGRYGISGAQPASVLLEALNQAWRELGQGQAIAEGAVCGPAGCA